jgi:hypothetical protein
MYNTLVIEKVSQGCFGLVHIWYAFFLGGGVMVRKGISVLVLGHNNGPMFYYLIGYFISFCTVRQMTSHRQVVFFLHCDNSHGTHFLETSINFQFKGPGMNHKKVQCPAT